MKRFSKLIACALSAAFSTHALSAEPLIVVDDRGGDSALPYYSTLKLQPRAATTKAPPSISGKRFSEADMLPIHSKRLSPGIELPRTIAAPGLTPLFLIGDDDRSRTWLRQRLADLLKIKALGLVINVENKEALTALRAAAPGLTLVPTSGDDLAQRLHLRHYPVLITATAIEQ